MDKLLDEFLNAFYETISFNSIDKFDSLRFESMFFENATLVERSENALRSETILEYLNRFLYESRRFPDAYSHGLEERQTGREYLVGEGFVFVKSDFQKTYFNGVETVTEAGSNYFTLCPCGDRFKIVCLAWVMQLSEAG